jgi:hypothetical protein
MYKSETMKRALVILALFLSGCDWDFGVVDEGYRGVFDKPQSGFSPTITAVIEGDMVTITSSDDSSTLGTFQPGNSEHFHVSAVVNGYNMADGAAVYVLYNGTEPIGYFNVGEKNIFYRGAANSDTPQDFFIRRGVEDIVL